MGGKGTAVEQGNALIRVGWIGAPVRQAVPDTLQVTAFGAGDTAEVASANVEVWLVDGGVPERMQQVVLRAGAPVVVRAAGDAAAAWWPHVAAGEVDLIAPNASHAEVVARLQGAIARPNRWNNVSARLATTAVHDLRSPLQGMRFTLAALEQEGALSDDFAEDRQMLHEIADTLEVLMHGIYNLGRRVGGDRTQAVDVTAVASEELQRPFFQKRATFEAPGPVWVRGNAGDVRYAILDVLRAAVQMSAKPARVSITRTGGKASLRVDAPVYAPVMPHIKALFDREAPVLLRGKVRLPLAGVAFARDVLVTMGGDLHIEATGPDSVAFTAVLPAVQEA